MNYYISGHTPIDVPVPTILTPPQANERRNVASEVLEEQVVNRRFGSSLKARIFHIPASCVAFFKDAQRMATLTEFFRIASNIIRIIGVESPQLLPALSIASSPFFLYHALKLTGNRMGMLVQCIKVCRVSEAVFWAGRSIESVGMAASSIIKPFAGSAQLSSLTDISQIALTFTLVIPLVLTIFGAIGGITETWATARTARAYHEFKHRKKDLDGSFAELEVFLEYLQGPKENGDENSAAFKIRARHFDDTHFTNSNRKEAIQDRIRNLFFKSSTLFATLTNNDIKNAKTWEELEFIENLQGCIGAILDEGFTFEHLEQMDQFYVELQERLESLPLEEETKEFLNTEFGKLSEKFMELRAELYLEGMEIVGDAEAEIHRKFISHFNALLLYATVLTSGALFLFYPEYHMVAAYLALGGSGINLFSIVFDRYLSQKQFYAAHRFLRSLVTHSSPQLSEILAAEESSQSAAT